MRYVKVFFTISFLGILSSQSFAQDNAQSKPLFGDTKLVIVGNAQADYYYNKDENGIGNIAFKPIFLWSLSDKLFIESEMEIPTDEGSVELVLEYVNMVYFVNNNLTLHFGRFLPKFGGYRGKFGEAFLNRFPNDPVGFGDGGIGAMTETGFGAQGGANLGKTRINYDFYLTNGPQLLAGSADAPDEAGQFEYEAYRENNNNKAIGGRFGFLPLSDASLEVGLSFQHADKTGDIGTNLENVKVDMFAVDLNYVHLITPLNSTLRVLGEWKKLDAGKADYVDYENGGTYTFDNSSTAYYILAAIRPTGSSSPFFSNLELAGRYSQFDTPKGAVWGGGLRTQTAVGLNYWLGWNRVLKFSYQTQTDESDTFIAQLVYGF